MADPLSIASGVAGLITLADVVIERTYKTILTCKNAGKDAQRLLREVQSLLGILKSLHTLELQVNNNTVFRTRIPPDQLHHCQTMLEKLRDKLQCGNTNTAASKMEKAWRTLMWPLTSSETDTILAQIERYKSTFDLTVSMDTLEAMLMAKPALDSVADDIAEIKQSLYRMEITQDRKATFEFFRTFDSEQDYQQGRKSRQAGTGLWLIESDELRRWLTERNSKLWLYGMPGAGKTVLASAIIEEAMRAASSAVGVAFYFCDYKTSKKRELRNILASLAGQLARQDSRCFDLLQNCYKPNDDSFPRHGLPDADELMQLLRKMSSCFNDVMIIVDALDECFEPSDVSEKLRAYVTADDSNIKIALLSRDEFEIKCHMADFVHLSIKARSSDLRLYVSSEIEERTRKQRLRIRSSELKDEILEELISGADGMFRWVACQLDYLCDLPSDAARRKALKTLPPGLDKTYHRIFQRINLLPEYSRTLVQRTLHWLIGEDTPQIKSNELCEAVSIEDGDRAMDPEAIPDVDEILYRCSSLVRLSVKGDSVELAHFTVEEYLRGPALKSDPELAQFHYSPKEACLSKVRTCLTCINMDELSYIARTNEHLEEKYANYPFYVTACLYWDGFLLDEDLTPQEWCLVHRLFSPEKTSHFQAWAQVTANEVASDNVRYEHREKLPLADLNAALRAGPLHFACMLNRPALVKWLVDQGCDVNEHCPGIGVPLHCTIVQTDILDLPQDDTTRRKLLERLTPLEDKIRLAEQEGIVRFLLASGANPNIPLSGPGRLHNFPMIVLACLSGMEAAFAEAGAIIDSRTLEYLSGLEKEDLALLYINRLLACVRVDAISERDQRALGRLALYADKVNPSTLEAFSLARVSTEILSLQTETFLAACSNNDLDTVEQLQNRYRFQFDDLKGNEHSSRRGLTPFLCAAWGHAIEVLAYLLCHGVNRNQKCPLGRNAIHYCLSRATRDSETLRILLEANIECKSPDGYGLSPVHICAIDSNAANLQLLLDHGADLSALDHDNRSVMHLVAERDQLAMYRILRKALPQKEFEREMLRKDKNGQSPLHLAASTSPTVFQSMVDDQARPTVRANDGRNIWHFAARLAPRSAASLMLVSSLDTVPIVTSYNGSTVLHDLIEALPISWTDGRSSTGSFLIALDSLCNMDLDFSATNDKGQNALHLLCEKLCDWVSFTAKHESISTDEERLYKHAMRRLLDVGLDPLLPTSNGSTCLNDYNLTFLEYEGFYREIHEILMLAVPDEQLLLHRQNGISLLAWAAEHRLDTLCHHLIQRGANPDERGEKELGQAGSKDESFTPLETMCRSGFSVRTFRPALERTQRLHERDRDGMGLLHSAAMAKTNGRALIQELLKFGIDVDSRGTKNYQRRTALMVAAMSQNPASVEELLKHGADPNALDYGSWSALTHASEHGCLESTRLLCKTTATTTASSVHVGFETPLWVCPLGLPAYHGQIDILQELLVHTKRIDGTDVSALWMACWSGSLEAVKILVEDGFNLAATDSCLGMTPLHAAAHRGALKVVEYLLGVGCKVDSEDKYGRLPIFYAIRGGHLNVVEKLKAHVIVRDPLRRETPDNSFVPCDDDHKALSQASYGVSEKVVLDMINRGDVNTIRLLQESGWDVDSALTCRRCTPLMAAILKPQHKVSQYLLEHGASLEVKGCRRHRADATPGHLSCRSPKRLAILQDILSSPRLPEVYVSGEFCDTKEATFLHEAARYGNTRAVFLLLDFGANVNAQDVYLRTPLHYAAQNGWTDVIRLLLRAGASANQYDASVASPSDLAISNGHERAVRILYEMELPSLRNDGHRISRMDSAARGGNLAVVKYLLSKGESIYSRDEDGHCALMSLTFGNTSVRTFTLNAGFMFNSADLLWLRRGPSIETYRKVLMRYDRRRLAVDVNARLNHGRTPHPVTALVTASVIGASNTVALLVRYGALINLEGTGDGTPLMVACMYGRLNTVKTLVTLGAVIAYRKNGVLFSAIHAAQHFPRIVHWLLVDRYCEQKLLPSCSASALTETHPSIEVRKLNLELIFMEDWDHYVNTKLMPPSKRRFIGRMEGDAGFIEETVA